MHILIEGIFEALGIKPNERFKIKDDNSGDSYYLDENLSGYCVEGDNSLIPFNANFLQDILRGKVEIVKVPKEPTAKDKIIIDYARLCGFNWIAVDEDESIVVSKDKLMRDKGMQDYWDTGDFSKDVPKHLMGKLSFLTWEDEPYYIEKEGE